MKHQWLVAKTH